LRSPVRPARESRARWRGGAERSTAALAGDECVLLSAPSAPGVARLAAANPALAGDRRVRCAQLGDVAFDVVRDHRASAGEVEFALIDDDRAAEVFEGVGAALFALEWTEFVSAEIDPEIAGMRSPERFAGAALRLIRKLRVAGISPDAFQAMGLRGATSFYARLPNLASPELIEQTQARYRDSLYVGPAELEHQRTREIDLVKIVTRLYHSYLESLVARGCLTRTDALVEAAELLGARPELRAAWMCRLRFCFVDDAQDLNAAQLRFLVTLFGEGLAGTTFAGDPDQRTLGFVAPRADNVLARASATFVLRRSHRDATIAAAAHGVLTPGAAPAAATGAVSVFRAPDIQAEAAFVADGVARAIAEGVAPREIAVIARSLRCIDPYLKHLLRRNVPVDVAGEGSLYDFGAVGDALAALWALADPYRHDWLLRNLEAPWLRLSDASIAVLCGEPPDAQTLLFEPPREEEDERARRWDRHRSLRLGRNVLRGDRDGDLSTIARERLAAFRAARRNWTEFERRADIAALARAVCADTVLAGAQGGAEARLRAALVERLLREIERFAAREPLATLLDFLLHAQRQAAGSELPTIAPLETDAVAVRSVEAAKGYEFSRVFVVDVRAGAFPRYYVPEAFVFTPRYGMIAKENAGGSSSAFRTAKFTYCQYKLRFRERYNEEERRAFYCAATRARDRLVVSAWGRATRGVTAPELLEELRPAAVSADRLLSA
jgi:superfamily I DNA/RNA helicase